MSFKLICNTNIEFLSFFPAWHPIFTTQTFLVIFSKKLVLSLSKAPQSGDPATALGQKHVKITKNIHQKSIKNPSKIHQKSIPNPSKNDQKSIQNPQKSILEAIRAFWSENVDFKGVPGAFWEVSWLRLGASWRCLGGV